MYSFHHEVEVALEASIAETSTGGSSSVLLLETALSDLCLAEFSVTMSSGTLALTNALTAVGARAGERVGVSAMGPVMTGQAVVSAGAIPVFLDSRNGCSFGLDTEHTLREADDLGLKAVVMVPMWGYWDEDPRLLDELRSRRISIIVDAAQAPLLRTEPALLESVDVVCLSLHGRKPFKAGEGGACLTNAWGTAERLVALRNFGQAAVQKTGHACPDGPFGSVFGVNGKINGLGAAWCLTQVRRADQIEAYLTALRTQLRQIMSSSGVELVEVAEGADVCRHGGYGLAVRCPSEDEALRLTSHLERLGLEVDTRRYAYAPMQSFPVFAAHPASTPTAAESCARIVACRAESLAHVAALN